MPALKSSNIASADYDDDTGEMTVVFVNGGEYAGQVPRAIYEGLIESTSPGSYYYRQVRDVYSMRKVG